MTDASKATYLSALNRYFEIEGSLIGNGCEHGFKPAKACPNQDCDARAAHLAWEAIKHDRTTPTTSTGEVPGEEDWATWPIVLQAVRSEIGKAQARGRPWDRPTTIGEVAMECRTMPACVERLIALCGYLISYVRDDSKPMTDWIVFEDGVR